MEIRNLSIGAPTGLECKCSLIHIVAQIMGNLGLYFISSLKFSPYFRHPQGDVCLCLEIYALTFFSSFLTRLLLLPWERCRAQGWFHIVVSQSVVGWGGLPLHALWVHS